MGRRSRQISRALLVAVLSAVVIAPAATLAIDPVGPPTIAMSFGALAIGANNTTSLTFTITNPNATALTGIAFGDTLPGGLVVASPNGLSGTCGGGSIGAASSAISLSGATLAASASCTFSVDITAISPGVQVNVTGNVTSTESGAGGTATASIAVGWAPTLGMTFTPNSIPLNGTTELTLTLSNPETNNIDPVHGLGFTVTLPAQLTVATGSDVCHMGETSTGTVATSGGHTISLTGASLPAGWQCSFSVTVTGPGEDGEYTATSSAITSDDGVPGVAASVSIVVGRPGVTPAPTSTAATDAPVGRADPTLPLLLLLAFVVGFAAVRRAAMRGVRADAR